MRERPQNKHLIPLNRRPIEERQAIARQGGKAHAEQVRKAKATAQLMQSFADMPILDKRTIRRLQRLGISDADMTYKILAVVALGQAAMRGDIKAFSMFMDILNEDTHNGGEQPLVIISIGPSVNPSHNV